MQERRIAIMTGGGDCPGINAVIRAVVKKAILDHGMTVIGIEDGYEGMIRNRQPNSALRRCLGHNHPGGTILVHPTPLIPTATQVKGGPGWSLKMSPPPPLPTSKSWTLAASFVSAGTAR